MAKKMYVVQADDGMFYCGMKYWDKQLRKAKIYHSLDFAEDVCKTYEECNCKIVEVSLTIVQETKTNADHIRSMSDEELATLIYNWIDDKFCNNSSECAALLETGNGIPEERCMGCLRKWLKQPYKENNDGL